MVAEHPSKNVNVKKNQNSDIVPNMMEQTEFLNIFDIVRNGKVSAIESFIEQHGSECLKSRDEWGYTPAHWAALDGNIEIMRYLVECNAPVDLSCLGTQGPRPIHWACRKGHTAIVQLLITAGVAVNATDFKGLTPLMTASMFGRGTTAAFLLGMGAFNHLTDVNGDTALHWAAYKGHPDLVRLLMYSGIDLQKPDNFGSTPLHLACLSGNSLCVKILSEKSKIELEPKDKNGKTPLGLAKSHRHSDIVQILTTEIKRRENWVPPLSEIWNLLFGGAGESKGPLLLFVGSILLWEYPMYLLRCVPISWNQARGSHYCFIYWNIIMWITWIIANRRDPGYIPLNMESYFTTIKQIPYFDKWKARENMLSRLCHTCKCLRPLRAKHCRICNRCVRYFDHHCPFIYNCIGVKNRMWFLLFVTSVALNCTFTIYFACYCIAVDGFDMLYVLGLLESLVFCTFGWILTCTSLLHACMNLTTNEMFNYKRYSYLKDKKGKYFNPFSRGPFVNLFEFFFCAPDPGYSAFEEDASI
ncbi:Palmitoyltransferase TIP1, putative [Pediculus humanus corporis]|uniref:Palmitoyltransferase n=1 Tax=Pediculus humanus subsp. corporis TaxID=121224 RepID=E0VP26_PEDHC|nr:Palmitoyltransferase TIP1, putative [Pediculus humanus corporis]EEB15132.1 Palmitoyltransferase TIP1, putative [Pediculus humanus corporis]